MNSGVNDRRATDSMPDRRRMPRGGRRVGDQPGRFPSLLIADSYAPARRPCVEYLGHFGFAVTEAENRDEVVRQMAMCAPHVILADSRLDGECDWQVLRQYAERSGCAPIPIIVMTSGLAPDARLADGLGSFATLVKPFLLTTMLDEIRAALRRIPPPISPNPELDNATVDTPLTADM